MKNLLLVLVALLLPATLLAGERIEDTIRTGSKAGQVIRVLTSKASPKEATVLRSPTNASLPGLIAASNAAVDLVAIRHKAVRIARKKSWPFTCYEFQVRAKQEGDKVVWSCWTPDFPSPHRFQLCTTETGKTYAAYVRAGIHLFRLSTPRDSEEIRRASWEAPGRDNDHPDALPLLPIEQIQEAIGWENTLELGPQTWNVAIDGLSELDGELRIALHGKAPEPRYVFALRDHHWVQTKDGPQVDTGRTNETGLLIHEVTWIGKPWRKTAFFAPETREAVVATSTNAVCLYRGKLVAVFPGVQSIWVVQSHPMRTNESTSEAAARLAEESIHRAGFGPAEKETDLAKYLQSESEKPLAQMLILRSVEIKVDQGQLAVRFVSLTGLRGTATLNENLELISVAMDSPPTL